MHPDEHVDLYSTIEQIIAKAIPVWNETLNSTIRGGPPPRITTDNITTAEFANRPRPPVEHEDELDEDDKHDLEWMWTESIYAIVPLEPTDWATREQKRKRPYRRWNDPRPINLRQDYTNSGLQVIVKMANMHLTPDKPTYDGGSWHIEGQLNEQICATALYYYSSNNISDSHLSFRERVSEIDLQELPYEQGQWEWIEEEFGFMNDVPFIQHLGRVDTKEGRLLTFPNVLQHRIEPFELEDKQRSGHRKVLALFLVDPNVRIPSTSIVPPQQKEWWDRDLAVSVIGDKDVARGFFEKHKDALIDLTEAKELRRELMAERSAWIEKDVNPSLQAYTNFCEH